MMNFIYENQGTNTYLVYEIGTDDELDTMSLGMLTNNTIPGLAAATFTQMDTSKYIKFNVSAKVSVSQLFSGPVNKKRLIGVFSGIIDAMLSAEDYMLDTDNLLLDLEYIFADVTTCETSIICLPVMNSGHKNPDLGMFFKDIIFNTQFDQTENCDHVAQILNYLNRTPVLSLHAFKELLDSIAKPKEPEKPAQTKNTGAAPMSQPVVPQPAAPVVSAPANQPQAPVIPKQMPAQPAVKANPVGQVAVPGKLDKDNLLNVPQAEEEKPISMFYLLQHYNKENAAKYKAQQAAKKAQKAEKKPAKPEPPKKAPAANLGFAVPGQTPQPMASNFAIPDKQETIQPAYTAPVQQPSAQPQVKTEPQIVREYNQPQSYQSPVQAGAAISFGETTMLNGGVGETTVLGATAEAARATPHLIRAKNNEKIPLNKPVFRIGKERSYVDYFVSDNTAVSRSHANIVNRDGEFFVVDTNSTNHTYVNGGMIQSNMETKLSHGTKLRFANEEFEFRLY